MIRNCSQMTIMITSISVMRTGIVLQLKIQGQNMVNVQYCSKNRLFSIFTKLLIVHKRLSGDTLTVTRSSTVATDNTVNRHGSYY